MDHRAVPGRMADMPPGAQGANPYVRPAMQRHMSGLRLVSEDRERIVRKDQMCVKCGTAITGQFVRALSGVYHLDCFTCADCGRNVASKFFSATPDMVLAAGGGDQFPLCETDYF